MSRADTFSPTLVSLIVVAYRQEDFIRPAIEGALAQTYSPLEIILSDDCSPDRTYTIMENMAKAYRGPHLVRLNRNQRNLGLSGHFNKCMEMVRGELVVGNAGDDISLSHRTATVVKAWEQSDRKAHSLYSDTMAIDAAGNELGVNRFPPAPFQDDLVRLCREAKVGLPGCAHAWHRAIFDRFGPMNNEIVFEDGVLPFRSRLLGTVAYIPEVLVLQRRCEGCLTIPRAEGTVVAEYRKQRALRAERTLAVYRQWRSDLKNWPAPPAGFERMLASLESKAGFIRAMQQPGFGQRWAAFVKALRHPANWSHVLHWYPICAFSRLYEAWIRSREKSRSTRRSTLPQ